MKLGILILLLVSQVTDARGIIDFKPPPIENTSLSLQDSVYLAFTTHLKQAEDAMVKATESSKFATRDPINPSNLWVWQESIAYMVICNKCLDKANKLLRDVTPELNSEDTTKIKNYMQMSNILFKEAVDNLKPVEHVYNSVNNKSNDILKVMRGHIAVYQLLERGVLTKFESLKYLTVVISFRNPKLDIPAINPAMV